MFGVFVMLGLGAIALPTEATTARSTLFGSILEPAPPPGSNQSFCRYCGSREREDDGCTEVVCQLTMGKVDMNVPLKNTTHHTLNDPVISVTTRGYNKNTPMGPTIKVRPGDTLKVTLINNLAEEDGEDAQMAGLTNFQHDYQATNLHTHGLHISGEDPADNVFRRVAPGDNHTYTYAIPKDHMPGTHWYHPHFHGPTGIQAGGGAVGLLIVEDVVGEHGTLPKYLTLPKILKEEKHLIILGVDANNQKGIERGGQTSVGGEGSGMLQCCLAYGNKSMSNHEYEKLCSAPTGRNPVDFMAENEELLEERGMRNREEHLDKLDDRCKENNNGASCSNEEVAELVNENCEAAAIWHVDGKLPDHTDKSNAVIAADQALFLVNGEYVPTLEFKANVWTRLRILFASITDQMYIVFPEFCEAQLLAKDGVYLHDAPRPVKYAFLGLGNRADLLIKCTEPDPNKYPNPTLLDALLYNQNDDDVSDNNVTDVVCNAADAIPHANKSNASGVRETLLAKAQGRITIPLMHMNIIQGDPAPTCKLPNFTVTRPCYLANLQDATKLINEEELTHSDGDFLHLNFGQQNGWGNASFFNINGKRYDEHALSHEHPMFSEQVGSLSQFNIKGVFDHAFHWHVVPFQLQTGYDEFETMREHYNLSNFLGEPYFQAGDWHDTLQVPPNWCHSKTLPDGASEEEKKKNTDKKSANNLTFVVRANVDTFVSRQVVHCHVLDHEDWGMMTILNFTENSDGNFTFWGNKLLDPTCFQNQTSNKGATVKAKDDGTFTGLCCAGENDRAGCGGGECIGQYYESLGYEAAVYALGGATRDLLFSTVPVPDREPDYFACA